MSTSLTRAIGLTFLVQVGTFAFGIFNNVLLSRWLGPVSLGVVVLLFQISEFIYKFTNLGIESSILYNVSNGRYPQKEIFGNVFSTSFVIMTFSSIVTIIFFYSGAYQVFFSGGNSSVQISDGWWCIFLIFAYLIFEYGSKILLGLQNFISYNKTVFFRPLVLAVLILISYLLWGLNVKIALIIYALSWILPGLFMWKHTLPFKPTWNKVMTKDFIGYGVKIMITNVFTFLSYRADLFFIGYFWSSKLVGWYYVTMIIAEKLHYLTQPTSTILFPAAAHAIEYQKKTPVLSRINFMVILLGAIFLAITARWIVPFAFSEQYQNSVQPLILLLPGIVALTLPRVLSADFSARGLPQISMYITIVIFIIKIVLNLIWIPRIGIEGAAMSSSVSYIIAAILTVYFYRRLTGVTVAQLIFPRIRDLKNLKKV